jgi:hypothetical protein
MTSKSKQQQQHQQHLHALTAAAALQLPHLTTVNHPAIIPTLPPGSQCTELFMHTRIQVQTRVKMLLLMVL